LRAAAGRSTQALAAMEDLTRIWPITDGPSYEITIYEGPDTFLMEYRAALPIERVLFSAFWLQAEVLNGGLAQFFSNDTGVLAPEAAEACRELGLPVLASKVEEAMAWFGAPYPRDRGIREAALAEHAQLNPSIYSPFDSLDDIVSDLILEESGGLEKAAMMMVEAHGS
jgi:hypothetical protein